MSSTPGSTPTTPPSRPSRKPLADADIIAKKWKGSCDRGADTAHLITCNNKVIGAQYFNKGLRDPDDTDWASPMDALSHGTHTATTAADNYNVAATVADTAIAGRVSALAPAARIAVYKVCWQTAGRPWTPSPPTTRRWPTASTSSTTPSAAAPATTTNNPQLTAMFERRQGGRLRLGLGGQLRARHRHQRRPVGDHRRRLQP
ncbi:hypothetical protein SALBM311S_04649 [Streptomyces alboniger]